MGCGHVTLYHVVHTQHTVLDMLCLQRASVGWISEEDIEVCVYPRSLTSWYHCSSSERP